MRIPSLLGVTLGIISTLSITSPVFAVGSFSINSFPNGASGLPYSQAFQVMRPGFTNIEVTSGSLPPGLRIVKSGDTTNVDYALLGTPTTPGSYLFSLRLLPVGPGSNFSESFSLTIIDPNLEIAQSILPRARVGNIYSQTLSVNSAISGRVHWSIVSGTLPTGMIMNAETGEISGTPTTAGTYELRFYANDEGGRQGFRTISLIVDGNDVSNPIRITTRTNPVNGRVGTPYSDQVYRAEGGNGVYSWSLSGNTPPGLSIDPLTGILSGTPTLAGTYRFYINANGFNMPGIRDQLATELVIEPATTMPTSMTPEEAAAKMPPAEAKKTIVLNARQKALWQTFERRWGTVRSRIHSTVARASTNLNKAPFNTLQSSKQIADFTLSLEDLNDEIPSYQLLTQAEMQTRIQQADRRMTSLGLLIRDTSKTWGTRDKATALQIRNDLINTRASMNLALQAFINFRRATPLQK